MQQNRIGADIGFAGVFRRLLTSHRYALRF
jgi:hypothetical protein